MTMAFQVGQLVSSKLGRDKGKHYIVLAVLDERFVSVADGSSRPVDNPKKKNMSHLYYHAKVDQDLAQKLNLGVAISDIEIRERLKRLIDRV